MSAIVLLTASIFASLDPSNPTVTRATPRVCSRTCRRFFAILEQCLELRLGARTEQLVAPTLILDVLRQGHCCCLQSVCLPPTNGIGGLGPVVQGTLTPAVVAALGWPGLFRTLAAVLLVAVVVLLPVAVDEWKAPSEAELRARKAKAT